MSEQDPRLRADPSADVTAGPASVEALDGGRPPEAVWVTWESLGDGDPALQAHPDLPAVIVFDERLLEVRRLSGKRLVFVAETLADLATRLEIERHPWPWLVRPGPGPVTSFSAWRRSSGAPTTGAARAGSRRAQRRQP